jgi:hypothetical protein
MRSILSLLLLTTITFIPAGYSIAQTPAPPAPVQPPVLKGDKRSDKAAPASQSETGISQEINEGEVISINTSLITLPVSVLDSAGNYVTDLEKDDFRIYDNGVEQSVSVFGQVTQPIFVVLLIDASGSVKGSLDTIKEAAIAFTDQLQANDYVFPVIFSGSIIPLLPQATKDKAALYRGRVKATIYPGLLPQPPSRKRSEP